MGTRYTAVFFAPAGFAPQHLGGSLRSALDDVDRQMSRWKDDSDLNRINGAAIGIWAEVPAQLHEVLATALDVERASHGAFNIAVGDAVSAWGFGPPARPVATDARRTAPCPRPSFDLELAPGRVRKRAAMTLDLDGIAKGYGVDRMAAVLRRFGLTSWLAGIDGELRAQGRKPDGSIWAVGHERPDRHAREAMGVIELENTSVATSGSYRHWREADGRVISHTIAPGSGQPLSNGVASATVLAPTCMLADAWATVLMVLGPQAAGPLLRARRFDWITVLDDGTVASSM